MSPQRSCRWAATLSVVLFAGCNLSMSVNGPVRVGAGQTSAGVSTVNGAITLETGCVVEGDCSAVNGTITVEDEVQVRKLNTVNGAIKVGTNVEVESSISTVNGAITCGPGTKIIGGVSTVNGAIELEGTETAAVETVNGDIALSSGSLIHGDVLLKGKANAVGKRNPRTIRIADSIVEGRVVVEDPNLEVTVVLSGASEIRGDVVNAEVVKQDEPQ